MQKIVIIGAGPTGLLLAHYLLGRGDYQIAIYERRPDPRQIAPDRQRTFPITLQLRGLRAIQGIPGLEKALQKHSNRSKGACMHRQKGEPRYLERQNSLLLIDRNQLVLCLLQKLLEHPDSDQVTIQFGVTCTALNDSAQTVTLQPETEKPFMASFDRLVGADGASSRVRDILVETGAMSCEKSFAPDVYKSVFVQGNRASIDPDQASEQASDMASELAIDRIHLWSINLGQRLIMAPQPGHWLHGTLIFPPDNNPLTPLNSADDVRAYFQENCPPIGDLMTPEEAIALLQRPVSKVPEVKCDRMHVGDRILLLGDAVHAVSPSIGQGCNAALQDVQVFNQLLDQCQDNWEQALPAFSAQRLPDVHAVRELADYSFPRSRLMRLEFIFRLTVGKKLRRWFPGLLDSMPMDGIMESELPYSELLNRCQTWVSRVKRSCNA